MVKESAIQKQYGDFQTPRELTGGVCSLLKDLGIEPASVVEPTCGEGNFLYSALQQFPRLQMAVGLEIDPQHISRARTRLSTLRTGAELIVHQGDFFDFDWDCIISSLPKPILFIGNPPWVTNSAISGMGGTNLPKKSNLKRERGIEAITGKGNFDVSEWMLLKVLDWVSGNQAVLAFLCKNTVARKVLESAWKRGCSFSQAGMYRIDASHQFGASVDSCLLVIVGSHRGQPDHCKVYDSLQCQVPAQILGYDKGSLLADLDMHRRFEHLEGKGFHRWRSGIKHDCSKVMEVKEIKGCFQNGLEEVVELESDLLYPLLKSSDFSGANEPVPSKFMIVTQRFVGEDTKPVRESSPNTWDYLQRHAALLDQRASSVYRNRPRFSIFGVGEYSFSPWKVAISGFQKRLRFYPIGPLFGKPVVLDDTCYFIPCKTAEEASFLSYLLESSPAQQFYSSKVFWDSKRPITSGLLQRLDLFAVAKQLGVEEQWQQFWPSGSQQGSLNIS